MSAPREFDLLIDIGNTFLKWGLFQPARDGGARENRVESGHALLEEISLLPRQFSKLPVPSKIVISNVAGTRVRAATIRLLEVWPGAPMPHWLIPSERECGVTNSYRNPAQLGSDRWAALIGARTLIGTRAAMVVMCGTATTLDFLSADGLFKGGMIMPGIGLMLRSLHEGTATLPDQDGEYTEFPKQTVDAIASGCQNAQAGAIERLYAIEAAQTPGLVCLLSGGAARAAAARIAIPFELHDNLVLEGLYAIAQTLPAT
ncbi:MAG TPA: type III pantothenate kinase [Casimicrobiaceae bacterium]|jgi:type III pantothenate kinase